MFLFILAILLAIIGLVLFIPGHFSFDGDTFRTRKWSAIPLGLALVLLLLSSVRTISPGTVAVPVTFGNTAPAINPGVSVLAPWTGLEEVTTRTQEYTMTGTQGEGHVAGNDAVPVSGIGGSTGVVDATIFYHVNTQDAERLYVQTKNIDDFIRVKTRTCIRDAFGSYDLVEAQNVKRGEVSNKASDCVHSEVEPRGVTVESFQLRNVSLSDELQKSVQAKLAAQQTSEQKKFEIESARQEAIKIGINNKAVSDGQQIVKCGGTAQKQDDGQIIITPNSGASCQNNLTPEYLQWAYIDMMKQIVASPNHDTVVIPAPSQAGAVTQPLLQLPVNK